MGRIPGQRCDHAVGLYFYNARYDDPALGRFIQPDAIVPDPGDPQSLNRYSYVGNNPLRYVDPSGHFSEDEIMKYLHADNWDAVLAMFEKGGKFAGAWGFLEVLRQAELGGTSQVDYSGISKEGWRVTMTLLKGVFTEQDGDLMLSLSDRNVTVDAGLMGYLGSYNKEKVSYRVNQNYIGNYVHTHIVDRGVDWVGAGFDVVGLAADLFSVGLGGRFVNGAQAAYRAKRLGTTLSEVSGRLDWISVTRSSTAFATDPNVATGMDVALDAAPLALDVAGIEAPFVFDAASLYFNLKEGLYIGP